MTSEIEFTHRDRGIAAEDLDLQPMENVVTLRVWELPVRILHWTVFTAVAVLTFTGFYIGNPFIVGGDEDAFLMGTIRAIHLAAAWAFSVSVICRVIWAFIGNHWAKWHQFLPVHKPDRHPHDDVVHQAHRLNGGQVEHPPGRCPQNPLRVGESGQR